MKSGVSAGDEAWVRTNRTGRRTYSREYKRNVVEQCVGPGVSVAATALAHRINANLVRRWIVQHRSDPGPHLLPVRLETTAMVRGRTNEPVAALRNPKAAPAGEIEIELGGARIRLRGAVDAQALRTVIAVLTQR